MAIPSSLFHDFCTKFFTKSPIGIALVDTEFRFIEVNTALARSIHQMSRLQHRGKTVREIVGDNYWEMVSPYYQEALAGKTVLRAPFIGMPRTGAPNLYSQCLSLYPLEDEGAIVGIGIVVEDTTEREGLRGQLQQHTTLINHIADAVISTDLSFRVTSWNTAAEILYGWKASEMLGKQTTSFLQTEFVSGFQRPKNWWKYLQTHANWRGEVLQRKKDGTMLSILSSVSAVHDAEHRVIGAVVVNRDISDLKHIQSQLQMEKDRANAIVSSAAEGMFGVDLHGNCTFINPAAQEILGYTEAECLGKDMHTLIHHSYPDGRPIPHEDCLVIKNFMKKKISRLIPETLWSKDGKAIPALVSCSPVIVKGKLVSGVVSIIDNREQQQASDELQRYKERLEQAQRAGKIGVFEWNVRNESLWFSPDQETLFGFEIGTFGGRPEEWFSRFHPEDKANILSEIQVCIAEHKDFELEFRCILPDGTLRWLKGKAHPYYGKDKKPTRLVGVCYDITARKFSELSLRFKAEASRILASSPEYRSQLQLVAKLAVRYFADWCCIDIYEGENLTLLASAHANPAQSEFAAQFHHAVANKTTVGDAIDHVLSTGKSAFYPKLRRVDCRRLFGIVDVQIIARLAPSSLIVVPIEVKGTPIGTISFITTESKRFYTDLDLQTAEQLASRASLSIENSLLYQDIEHERKRIGDLVSNVPGVVWESWGNPRDKNQRIDFVNTYAQTMLGYPVEQWLSSPNFWLQITHPEDRERAAAEAEAIFHTGDGGTSRFRWVTKDGKVLWVEAQSQVIRDRTGTPVGMRGVTMDISQRMELEKRKDEFIGMASHELKTPITSIKVYAQLVHRFLAQSGDAKVQKYIANMETQIDKLTLLVSDLLDVSKIQAGKLELRREQFSLQDLVTETVETMQATTTNHTLIVQGKIPELVFGDKDRITQVLINLLSNAMKYSPHASTVTIHLSRNNESAVVSVTDYGVGIPKQHVQKIFDRFYRVYDTSDKSFPGLGMGLYISSEIMRRHQGELWVHSTEGKGSTFSFSLPMFRDVTDIARRRSATQ